MNHEQARFNMIEQQIRPWEVLDPQVLQLLAVVKREDFVPTVYKALAFTDMQIPLPSHKDSGACMLCPKVEARLLQDLAVQKHESVLEIGAGSGYMSALLAHRARQVLALEIDPPLARIAEHHLQQAGIYNAQVRVANGAIQASFEPQQTFDVIVLSGSVAQVPEWMLSMLKIGGRLSAIVGCEPMMRATLVTRTGPVNWNTTQAWDTVAPRLLHFPEPSAFHF